MAISLLSSLLGQCEMLQSRGFASALTGSLTLGAEISIEETMHSTHCSEEVVAKVQSLWTDMVLLHVPHKGAASAALTIDDSHPDKTLFMLKVTNVASLPIKAMRRTLTSTTKAPLPTRAPPIAGTMAPLQPPHVVFGSSRTKPLRPLKMPVARNGLPPGFTL